MPRSQFSQNQNSPKHFWAAALLALLAIISYTVTFYSLPEHEHISRIWKNQEYLITIVFFLIMTLIILVTSRGQKSSEAARNETEENYSYFIHQAADPIVSLSELGIILTANTAVETISGYQPAELIGQHFLKVNILVGASMAVASREFVYALAGTTRPPFELTMMRKDGSLITTEAHARRMHTAEGKPIVQVIIRDITGHAQAKEKLLEERNKAQNYLNIARVMILAIDKHHKVTLINNKGCDILGYKENEVIGQDWFKKFIPQNRVEIAKKKFDKIMSGQEELPVSAETKIVTRSGEERLISWHNALLRDHAGKITGSLRSGQDITDSRRIEEQLHLQSAALEAAANAIVITDKDGIIIWVNPAFTQITGYTREEAIGQSTRILKSGLQNASFYENLWNTIKSGNIWHGEIINRRKDDKLYTEEATITPVRNKEGEIQNYIAIKRDITERKRLQQNLQQANIELEANAHKLEKTLKEMALKNSQLQAAQNQLIQSEKLAAIGVLSSGIAHEIKNPLAIIVLSIEEFEAISDKLDAQSKIYIQMIKRAADRANNVIIELLRFARASDLEADKVNIHELISGTFLLVNNSAKFKGLVLEHKFTDNTLETLGDRILLEQVFFNLLINAIDATARGGNITVESYTRKAYSSIPEKDEIVIEVRDTGSGIPPENLPRIFEPFFTTKEQGKGTGLGLSTVYTLLKRHNGTINVESTIGQGTTFIVTLPMAPKKT